MSTIEPAGMEPEAARLLFEAWLQRLSSEQAGFTGGQVSIVEGRRRVSIGDAAGPHFVVAVSGLDVVLDSLLGVDEAVATELIDAARAKVAAGDLGGMNVYQTELTVATFDLATPMHFMRTLMDQRPIEGARRISDVAILDFEEGLMAQAPPNGYLFLPECKVQLTLFVPGPQAKCEFSDRAAAATTEVMAAICAFAAGRPVTFEIPGFPVDEDVAELALARRRDWSILGLARDSVPLDIFGYLSAVGGIDSTIRLRGALLAYHSALNQTSPDVAVMLLVTCIEALVAPRQPWAKDKVTSRFIKAVIELCPDAVDALVEHTNVGEAFGYVRKGGVATRRRTLLSLIYDARSNPTHTGPTPARAGMLDMHSSGNLRVALLSGLAMAAVLAYLQAPRSFLIGHPVIDPKGE